MLDGTWSLLSVHATPPSNFKASILRYNVAVISPLDVREQSEVMTPSLNST